MKHLLLVAAILLSASSTFADKYKILYLNHPVLKINNKPAKVGDVFDDNATIVWAKERQAMRVFNMTQKKQMLMVAHYVNPKGVSVLEILTSVRHLSTHSVQSVGSKYPSHDLLRLLNTMFESKYELMDEILVPSPVELSDKKFFQATYNYGDTRITKNLSHKDNQVVIDKTLFTVAGKKLTPRDVVIDITYIDEEKNVVSFVASEVEIFVIPDSF